MCHCAFALVGREQCAGDSVVWSRGLGDVVRRASVTILAYKAEINPELEIINLLRQVRPGATPRQ